MRRAGVVVAVALAALSTHGVAWAQPKPTSKAVEEFAEMIGTVIFAAGQTVIQARVCGGDEQVGHAMRKRVDDRARQCAEADPRLKEIVDHMEQAFDGMLKNADAAIARRGKEAICALYRGPELQVEVATALEMAKQFATDAGHERISRMPCPARE